MLKPSENMIRTPHRSQYSLVIAVAKRAREIAEEAEKTDGIAFPSGDEISVRIPSPMTKEDYVSFVSYVTCDRAEIVKLYPEQPAEVLFLRRGHGAICYFTLREGLFFQEV